MIEAKRHFTFCQGLAATVGLVRSVPRLRQAKERLGKPFIERLMLAVTEVNGCAACAWGHTKAALEAGLDSSEISELLGGDTSSVPPGEAVAVAFAQHYADSAGHPSEGAWEKLKEEYGTQGARDILAMIRMIMWGNAYGIPLSALIARRRGKTSSNSSLLYEVGMVASPILKFPIALVLALVSSDSLG